MSRLSTYEQAVRNVARCDRCEFWQRSGLSSRCPTCDRAVFEEVQRLNEGKPSSSALGVLFDKASAMFINFIDGRAEFKKRWNEASQVEYAKFRIEAERSKLLREHNISDVEDDLVFIALDKFMVV